MQFHIRIFLFVAFTTTEIMSIVGVSGLLLARPCFNQGNPWIMLGTIKRHARPVAIMDENAGHNPFNTFPGMVQYGNCVEVHFTYSFETINITIVCGRTHDIASRPYERSSRRERPQCPVHTSDIKWPLANLVYLEYDVRRFELSSCVALNKTHSYHGHLLLTDDIETRSYMLPDYLPMWRKKLQQPGMVPFEYKGNCSECNFRNEYVAFVPNLQQNILNSPPEAQQYCNEANVSESKTPNSHITIQVNVATSELMWKLFVPTVVIFGAVLLLRFCLCSKKPSPASVVPEMPPNVKQ